MKNNSDEVFMKSAFLLAQKAAEKGEVPIGAVIVKDAQIIAEAHNLKETTLSPTHHAELMAIEAASKILNNWRLIDCVLYTTLEPCVMCAGAILQARIPRVVIGTKDPKGGAFGSLYNLHQDARLNHQVEVDYVNDPAIYEKQLKDFFKARRLSPP